MGYRGPESSLLSKIKSLWSHKRFHTAFFTDAVEFPDFPFEHTQCAGRECGVLLHSGLALQGLVDVDSVWRQGSSQCGKTTGHSLSTPNQLRAVDLRERGRGGKKVEEEKHRRKEMETASEQDIYCLAAAAFITAPERKCCKTTQGQG